MILTITDETTIGKVTNEIKIEVEPELLTIKGIIEARVRHEVEAYNQKLPEYYNGLVEPGNAEKTLNGYKLRNKKQIDAEKQVYVALDAFQKNGYFVLVDDLQVDTLDQQVKVNEKTKICFIKLTPLVGG